MKTLTFVSVIKAPPFLFMHLKGSVLAMQWPQMKVFLTNDTHNSMQRIHRWWGSAAVSAHGETQSFLDTVIPSISWGFTELTPPLSSAKLVYYNITACIYWVAGVIGIDSPRPTLSLNSIFAEGTIYVHYPDCSLDSLAVLCLSLAPVCLAHEGLLSFVLWDMEDN